MSEVIEQMSKKDYKRLQKERNDAYIAVLREKKINDNLVIAMKELNERMKLLEIENMSMLERIRFLENRIESMYRGVQSQLDKFEWEIKKKEIERGEK